jgi:hypothetical protein
MSEDLREANFRKLTAEEYVPRYRFSDIWIFPEGGEVRKFTGPGGHYAKEYGYPLYQKIIDKPEEGKQSENNFSS